MGAEVKSRSNLFLLLEKVLRSIKRNWLLGMRIQYEVLKEQRAEYGEQVIKKLATDLVKRYGRGFS